MQKVNDQDLEKLLRSLPKVEKDPAATAVFFEKLEKLASKKEPDEKQRKPWWQSFRFPQFVAALTATIIIIFTGSFVWAYQPRVTRGTFFYPLKQVGERAELAFSQSPFQKVETHLKFSDRRFEEAEYIVENHPSLLSVILPVAEAHDDEVHLDTEEKVALAETLHAMYDEVTNASVIIEQSLIQPFDVEKALGRVEVTTDHHLEGLKRLEKKTKKEVKQIIRVALDEEDEHLATVIEAREEVKEAVAAKREAISVKLKKQVKKQKLIDRKQEAEQEVKEILELFAMFPESEKDKFEPKIEMLQEALEQEKFGRAMGLSRALQNQMEGGKITEREEEKKLEEEPEESERED